MPDSSARLSLTHNGDRIIVVGEIDAHTSADFAARLDPLPGSGNVHLDLSGVGFIDSSGLRVIIGAHQRAEDANRKLLLEQPSRAIERIIEVSGLSDHLHVVKAS